MKRSFASRIFRASLSVIITLLVVFLLSPLLITVIASFSTGQYIDLNILNPSTRWYERVANDSRWMEAAWVSVRVAVLSTAIVMVIGTAAALGISKFRSRLKGAFQALLIAPLVVPLIVIATAEFFLFQRLGMLDSVLALALGHTVVAMPLMVLIVTAALSSFDYGLEEAAVSLGAPRWLAIIRVTIPSVRPAIFAGAAFTFLSSFDELMIPLFISGPNTQTLSVRIWDTLLLQVEPTIAAVSTILIVMALVFGGVGNLLNKRSK